MTTMTNNAGPLTSPSVLTLARTAAARNMSAVQRTIDHMLDNTAHGTESQRVFTLEERRVFFVLLNVRDQLLGLHNLDLLG